MRAAGLLFGILLVTGCANRGRSFAPDLEHYASKPQRTLVLGKQLLEISGICYRPNGQLAAINDEDGKLFFIDAATGRSAGIPFGKRGDYEDIAFWNDHYYVMESNGNMHELTLGRPVQERTFSFPRKKRIEFESLYADERLGKLVLLSKEQRESLAGAVAYSFDPLTGQFSDRPVFHIKAKDIRRALKNSNAEFRPSAAAMHPILGKLFVIASDGKALLQCTREGDVEKAWDLNPDHFPQPEGITFAPNGDLYISNEGLAGKATILVFKFN